MRFEAVLANFLGFYDQPAVLASSKFIQGVVEELRGVL